MKILRSKGRSFTEATNETVKEPLARGLFPRANKILTPTKYRSLLTIKPEDLSNFVAEDYSLILRQTISVLDKVVRKANLRYFEVDAYADRVFLADALWQKLCDKLETDIRKLPEGDKAFQKFRDDWAWKIHPYAKKSVNKHAPHQDENADIIKKHSDENKQRKDFEGRWHDAMWIINEEKPNFSLIADRIMSHLFIQELMISGEPRQETKDKHRKDTGVGFLVARGLIISKSVNDPRERKRARLAPTAGIKREHTEKFKWTEEDVQIYFKGDIVKTLYREITSLDSNDGFYHPLKIGDALYKHFGKVLENYEKGKRDSVWNLHNKVRQFYQKLLKSERFRRAYREAVTSDDSDIKKHELKKLKSIVPENHNQILSIFGAKERNADVSELIRLGKLVAHASDIASGTENVQSKFEQNMEYLVTSEGQSEIKRNETFTRIWRNSIGLSLQTLKAWINPKTDGNAEPEDLADIKVAKKHMEEFNCRNSQQFLSHLPLIFGNKIHVIDSNKVRRSDLFSFQEQKEQKDILWAFLRLAGAIRNRTNHFNTKIHFVDLITGGILSDFQSGEKTKYENRKISGAYAKTLQAFEKLLAYDKLIQNQVISDELNRLEITRYTTKKQSAEITQELSKNKINIEFTPPRFMSVMNKIKGLASDDMENLDPLLLNFATLELSNRSLTVQGENSFKVGILRQLYGSGFIHWLSSIKDDESFIQKSIRTVIDNKKARSARGQEDKRYAIARSMAEKFQLDSVSSLNELFSALLSQITTEQRISQSYKANRKKQGKTSNWIDEFKQELFGHFLGHYMKSDNLKWLWDIKDNLEKDEKPVAIDPDTISNPNWTLEKWHAQFYAWLYLVPSDQIALLRHQIKKTTALEHKSDSETDQDLVGKLANIDRLMGLYTRVQQAGFDGTEHQGIQLELGKTFYEKPALFEQVYSTEYDDNETSLSGTRKGLRQVLRFSHFTALESIFKKHKITAEEVSQFTNINSKNTKKIFEDRKALRELILEQVNKKKPAQDILKALCEQYKDVAAETALHNFKVNGARLSDHTRLHQLMMRIVGRLTDFTLMWEKDRLFLFLGLLYSRLKEKGEDFKVSTSGDDTSNKRSYTVNISLPQSLLQNNKTLTNKIKNGNLQLWNDEKGIMLKDSRIHAALLEGCDKELFNRFFGTLRNENPKDVEAALLIKEENKSRDEKNQKQTRKTIFNNGSKERHSKTKIRNDFAHFNVIKKPLRLSYRINVVRSLLSYDRKLKNTVIKAINKILNDEGFIVEWKFKQDRVTKPLIIPQVETHLTMVKKDKSFNPQFELPMNSVRFTSMVKALFDFDSGGYREMEGEGKNRKATGVLHYPKELRERHGERIPSDMFNIRYEKLPPK